VELFVVLSLWLVWASKATGAINVNTADSKTDSTRRTVEDKVLTVVLIQ
jgi:hypothetical protein